MYQGEPEGSRSGRTRVQNAKAFAALAAAEMIGAG